MNVGIPPVGIISICVIFLMLITLTATVYCFIHKTAADAADAAAAAAAAKQGLPVVLHQPNPDFERTGKDMKIFENHCSH